MQELGEICPLPSPRRNYKNYADYLEPLFQNGMLLRLVSRQNGCRRLSELTGVPKSTIYEWNQNHFRDPTWRPWHTHREGMSLKFSREDCELLRQTLLSDPRMSHKEVNADVILQMLRGIWTTAHPHQEFPQMSVLTVRRLLRSWGWTWRRSHKRRRPGVDPRAALHFVHEVMFVLAEEVEPWQVVNADEMAFLLYPHGYYTWARRGRDAVQIHVEGNEKQSYTVMAAVTMDCRKLPLFTIVQGKTVASERGLELDPQGPHVSAHTPSGWMTTEAMMAWLWFLRRLPEYSGGQAIHVILDGYATHVCDDVRALADELGIVLHFIPPGLTDLLQPLDRSVFGAFKAEYRAIYRRDMAQREDRRMTKADFAAYLILAWELVSDRAIQHGWECYDPDTTLLEEQLREAVEQ